MNLSSLELSSTRVAKQQFSPQIPDEIRGWALGFLCDMRLKWQNQELQFFFFF